ncbi:MAG: LLM class F420-dependent oxidoreductase [Pseudomonadales bacterium]
MKIGCQMAFNDHTPPAYIAEAGRIAEAAGFHSLWVPEHVLFFPEYASKYPYSDDGRLRGDPKSLLDPFSALTFVAASTSRIRLGTGICLVPQRNPVYTAKQVADLDYLSGGRVDFGIGIGWLREEFEALGVPWQNRAGRTLECIEVMKTLWCDEVSSHHGERFRIEAAYQNPKPVQKPHPPLFFGGESDAALQRVALVGQGWFGFNLTPTLLEERLAALDGLLAQARRSRADVQIFASPAPAASNREDLAAFAALGVDQVILGLFARDADQLKERAGRTLDLVA